MMLWFLLNDVLMKRKDDILEILLNVYDSNKKIIINFIFFLMILLELEFYEEI